MQNLRVLGDWEVLPMDPPFFKGSHQREIHAKWYIGHISAPGPQIKKLRSLSFLQLLKFEKSKCTYFFDLWPRSLDFGNFFHWRSWCKVRAIVSGRNCQYLGSWATNQKSKDTLLSQTLKVEEKKVSLVFLFVAQEPRYGHFIFWSLGSKVRDIVKWENPNILAPGPQIKKIRTLCFLKL